MFLLDVLPYDPDRVRRIRPVIRETVQDSIDAIKDTIDATKDAVADSAAQAQLILDGMGTSQSDSSLLMPIAAVVVALGACVYLAHLYKGRMQTTK